MLLTERSFFIYIKKDFLGEKARGFTSAVAKVRAVDEFNQLPVESGTVFCVVGTNPHCTLCLPVLPFP